jgi:hypothetical protein
MCSCYIVVQQWDVETALFNYCADKGPLDLDHLEANDKRELIVKLRHDVDTVILKTELLLNDARHEAEERYLLMFALF